MHINIYFDHRSATDLLPGATNLKRSSPKCQNYHYRRTYSSARWRLNLSMDSSFQDVKVLRQSQMDSRAVMFSNIGSEGNYVYDMMLSDPACDILSSRIETVSGTSVPLKGIFMNIYWMYLTHNLNNQLFSKVSEILEIAFNCDDYIPVRRASLAALCTGLLVPFPKMKAGMASYINFKTKENNVVWLCIASAIALWPPPYPATAHPC